MTTAKPSLTLRLAARTLIEWKTPTTSPEYQYVLAELLKVHPNAVSSGFTADKQFLKLDDRGVVLWYLSETMDGKRTELAANQSEKYIDFLKQEFVKGLINYGISEEANSRIWLDGPTKSQVADTILEVIDSNDKSVKSKGFACIIAILIPLSSELQLDIIRDLMYIHRNRSGVLQDLSKFIKKMSMFTSVFTVILFLVSVIFSITSIEKLSLIFSEKIKDTDFRELLISITTFFLSFLIFFNKQQVQEFTKSIVMSTSRKDISTIIKRKAIDSVIELFQTIGDICSKNPKVFREILKSNCQVSWKEIALTSTKNATSDVIQEVLYLLRHPDIDYSLREQIFQWLCRVNLI